MLDNSLDKTDGILSLEPKGPLTADDFKALTADVDGYLAGHDSLNGILLSVAHVPGWENFGALFQHKRFVRDHHRRIARVAVRKRCAACSDPGDCKPCRLAVNF